LALTKHEPEPACWEKTLAVTDPVRPDAQEKGAVVLCVRAQGMTIAQGGQKATGRIKTSKSPGLPERARRHPAHAGNKEETSPSSPAGTARLVCSSGGISVLLGSRAHTGAQIWFSGIHAKLHREENYFAGEVGFGTKVTRPCGPGFCALAECRVNRRAGSTDFKAAGSGGGASPGSCAAAAAGAFLGFGAGTGMGAESPLPLWNELVRFRFAIDRE